MSVPNNKSKKTFVLGATVTTGIPTDFFFLDNSHLRVILIKAATSVPYVLAINTSYTVANAGVESGGTVTLTGATVAGITPVQGDIITITRNLPFVQAVDYVPNAAFPASVQERALDELTMAAQQVKAQADTALRFEEGENRGTVENPDAVATSTVLTLAGRKGKLLGFNLTTGAAEYTDKAAFTTSVSNAAAAASLAAVQPSLTTAANSATAASNSATAANNSAVSAAGSVSRIAGYGAEATRDAGIATTKAAEASASANNAATSASNAGAAATEADNARDEINALGALTNADKGVANGVATLDATTKVPTSQIPTTQLAITFRQGTDAERAATLLAAGEPAYTTDLGTVWIGDGSTNGGRLIGGPVNTQLQINSMPQVTTGDGTAQPRPYSTLFVYGPGTVVNNGGTGAVGTSVDMSTVRSLLAFGGVGGRNHATGSGAGGNAGALSTALNHPIIVMGSGDGGNAGATANGGIGGASFLAASGSGFFAIKAGRGGDGHATGTGNGGSGGRTASILILGGKGGAGGLTAAGGTGGSSANVTGITGGIGIDLQSGAGGNGDAAVGGTGGRIGAIAARGGNGGNAVSAVAGGAGGNAGCLIMNGGNGSGITAGKIAGNINTSGGTTYDGGSLDLSDGKLDFTVRSVLGQLTQRIAVPATSASTGMLGQWSSDDSYLYYYGATGWRRIAGSSF